MDNKYVHIETDIFWIFNVLIIDLFEYIAGNKI